jgi:leucyl-tRNA synthetase
MAVAARAIPSGPLPKEMGANPAAALRQVHRTIAAVGEDLEKFRFNSAVARVRELTNTLADLDRKAAGGDTVFRLGMERVAQLLNPLMPHIAEEMWEALGHKTILADTPWPDFDPAMLQDDIITLAVQVNGKLRGTVDVAKGADTAACELAALALPAVQRQLDGKPPRKVIVVRDKIVNIVAA